MQEFMDITTTEQRPEHVEKVEDMRELTRAIKKMLSGPQKTSLLGGTRKLHHEPRAAPSKYGTLCLSRVWLRDWENL